MKIDGKRVRVEYLETYNDKAVLGDEYLPILKHIGDQYIVTHAQLLKAGFLADGREFQEIRVVFQEKPESPLVYADKILDDGQVTK